MDLEALIRAEIAKFDPGIGFSDAQVATIIEMVKNIRASY
jgi:hypothetical protein